MRRALFWLGWIVLLLLPVVYGIQIYLTQDLPRVEVWKWTVLGCAALVVYFARSHDDVLKHHVV